VKVAGQSVDSASRPPLWLETAGKYQFQLYANDEFLASAPLEVGPGPGPPPPPARRMTDLLLVNGTIHTLDPARPRARSIRLRRRQGRSLDETRPRSG
jgi:hypothetical protein